MTIDPHLQGFGELNARERALYAAALASRPAAAGDNSQTETVSARLALAMTAISPWIWNWYVFENGWGPEMDAVIASSMSVLITLMLSRSAES